jgi:glycosyltransferase involved in cell wall biosynthesis
VRTPLISVVVPAYNAAEYIAESLTAVLSQTRSPDEVIVVDDGSTDATPRELERFGFEIRVVRQENRGHPGAYNRGFAEARGDYVARCDADDIWEPAKLERQIEALATHPEIDIAFGGARIFGLSEGHSTPPAAEGLLGHREFAQTLYRGNLVCASTTLIRRRLYREIGPFRERLPCEDYDYWLRALKAGAVFFYDAEVLARYRRHEHQITHDLLRMQRAAHLVHGWHADVVDDRQLVRTVLARDMTAIGRLLVDEDWLRQARTAFVASLRHRPTSRGLAWALVLSAPERYRRTLIDALISRKRALPSLVQAAAP